MQTKQEPNKPQEARPKEKVFFTATELISMDIEKVPTLWNPFLPLRGLAGLTGSSDTGKSTFLRQLAMSVCTRQKEFLGYPLTVRSGNVLYVSTEDDKETTAASLGIQSAKAAKEKFQNLHFLFDCMDLIPKMETYLKSNPTDLVILDVWSDTFIGNPNSWVDIRQNLNKIKHIADTQNTLILILHHSVKNSEKSNPDKAKLNGSQALEAKLRSLLELRNGKQFNERVMYVLKNNSMPRDIKEQGLILNLDDKTRLFSYSGEKVSISQNTDNSNGVKYDREVWVPRMMALRKEDLSYEDARNQLLTVHKDESIPSLTWFKTNCRDSDGQSAETLANEGPTVPNLDTV